MKIGILGAGSVGATLGKAWVKRGHEVMFGVRDVNALSVQTLLTEAGANARAGTVTEAVANADAIALTLTWEAVPEVLKQIGELSGKVLLDCTNPLVGNQLDASLLFRNVWGRTGCWLGTKGASGENLQHCWLGKYGKSPVR